MPLELCEFLPPGTQLRRWTGIVPWQCLTHQACLSVCLSVCHKSDVGSAFWGSGSRHGQTVSPRQCLSHQVCLTVCQLVNQSTCPFRALIPNVARQLLSSSTCHIKSVCQSARSQFVGLLGPVPNLALHHPRRQLPRLPRRICPSACVKPVCQLAGVSTAPFVLAGEETNALRFLMLTLSHTTIRRGSMCLRQHVKGTKF